MKRRIVIILICIVSVVLAHGQSSFEIPQKLKVGIKKGDAAMVADYFNEHIEMSITKKENLYSKTQAEFVLQKFFRSHKPQNFYIDHQGGKKNTNYIIGNLQTRNGNFKLILLLKKNGKTVKVHQLRIEHE